MDIKQAAETYQQQVSGFNLETGPPSREAKAQAMQALIDLAHQSDTPADGKFKHLDELVGRVAEIAPASAEVFNKCIVENPEQREFAKSLETTLTVMENRSPETWQHSKNVTALAMTYYERQTGLTPENINGANQAELLTLMTGALGHDFGKVAIDPELLHKPGRVVPEKFNAALEHYRKEVPNYPEKLHDAVFLEEANMGHILFAEPGKAAGAQGKDNATLADLGKDMRRSETHWVGNEDRQKYNAIWRRINANAQANLKPEDWLSEKEQQALTMPRRGTLTREESRVTATHDDMSEAFFKQAPVPSDMKGVQDIVNMQNYRTGATHKGDGLLGDVVHTVDVFEAITGKRSYRKPYTKEEAMKVMDDLAVANKINSGVYAGMKSSGALDAFAENVNMTHSPDLMKPAQPAKETSQASERPQISQPAITIKITVPEEQGAWASRVGKASQEQPALVTR